MTDLSVKAEGMLASWRYALQALGEDNPDKETVLAYVEELKAELADLKHDVGDALKTIAEYDGELTEARTTIATLREQVGMLRDALRPVLVEIGPWASELAEDSGLPPKVFRPGKIADWRRAHAALQATESTPSKES